MDDEETLTAYHEAGHAVIGYALGGVIDSIQLGGEADDQLPQRFGDCRIHWGRVVPFGNWHLQREILTMLAGPAAEMVYQGEKLDPRVFGPWQDDWRTAWEIGHAFATEPRQREQILWILLLHLERLLRSDHCWPAVAALADALQAHEFLDREQAEEILRFWVR